ncbi:DUF3307 domain-containing protein [Roseibacterium sp. SDUM158017]|uniref:DUF3307 domain-containing protein n=1 Tax=Roseicyclus salinarum TaxID=3036773 RepID=UPI002414D226|nr:DUF3307 domain-containing protein [Roseibacterium sp. SDUM158017]MDG4649191.1 DUF3307 domain-containing protein [Roseibacterium sp. SDUM158017]
MLETLAALAFAHVVADYLLQTRWIVENKRGAGFAIHIAIVFAAAVACLGQVSWIVLWITAAHLAIDATKTLLLPDRLWSYLADQAAHFLSVALLAALFPLSWETGVWGGVAPAWVPVLMAAATGFVFATRAGQFAIGLFLREALPSATSQPLAPSAATIGLLERAIIVLLVLAGAPWAVVLLIAAKAVWQFAIPAQGKAAREQVITGSVASFAWGIAVALVTQVMVTSIDQAGIQGP